MEQNASYGNNWLYQDILMKLGEYNVDKIEIPQEISENINLDFKLRDYQKKAFQMFISYLEQYQEKPNSRAVLFNMATGSGKTLIMAGLILYLYKRGYNNFLFFVNSNNIIEKTKDNFLNSISAKYLFSEKIVIDGKKVVIREVENFDSANKNEINICFTTIQKLHGDMHTEKENVVTFDSFRNKKVVLIADEAHHGQVQTKQNTIFDKPNWENTIEEILKKDKESFLLEFTATMGFENNPSIKEKYLKRLLYKYDLANFRNEKFSKDIELFRVDGDKKYRMLTACLVNQYRQDIASKYAKVFPDSVGLRNFKPVILFKAQKEIEESFKNYEDFRKIIDELEKEEIEEVKNRSNEKIMKRIFDFYETEGISIQNLIKKLQLSFAEKNCLNVNEESLDKKSLNQKDKEEVISQEKILNSLEDVRNNIRVIFAVQKLNEGWDVLNLYDIVRVSDKQATGGSNNGKIADSTISEAQLIGRGARYFPFKIDNSQDKYKRKFDESIEDELRILEELYFHSYNESRYVADLKNAIREKLGIDLDDSMIKDLTLKSTFKETSFYKNGIIYLNQPLPRDYSQVKSFKDLGFLQRNEEYEIYSGKGEVSLAFNDSKYDNSKVLKIIKTISLSEIEPHIIKNALSKINFFNFNNLARSFPSALSSINDLILKKEFLADIRIDFKGTKEDLENITNKQKLDATILLLNKIKEIIGRNITTFIGSDFINQGKVSEIFRECKQIKLPRRDIERCNGMEDFLKDKEWYVYNANYGTDQERYCVEFISKLLESENLKDKYEEIYLIRNELFFKIYDFDTGEAFAPDFLLILRNKQGVHLTYQIFLEPKGTHIEKADEWKQNFLLKVKERFNSYGLKKFIETKNYRLLGVSFYNKSRENEIEKELQEILK